MDTIINNKYNGDARYKNDTNHNSQLIIGTYNDATLQCGISSHIGQTI